MNKLEDGLIKQRGPGCKFLGQSLCTHAFREVIGVSKRKFQKFQRSIRDGHASPPADGRSMRQVRDVPKADHANTFFQFLYDHLAEPLAEGDPDPEPEDEMVFEDEFSFWIRGEAAENPAAAIAAVEDGPGKAQLPQKWLGVGSGSF